MPVTHSVFTWMWSVFGRLGLTDTPPDAAGPPRRRASHAAPSPGEALLAALMRRREALIAQVAQTTALTEARVLAAGERLGTIVADSQRYAGEVQRVLTSLDQETVSAGVVAAIEAQSQTLSGYIEWLDSERARQVALSEQALALCAEIQQAADRVNELITASTMVSLNANIHARALGDSGHTLCVIARELQATGHQVRAHNARVALLTAELVGSIRATVAQADELQELAQSTAHRVEALSNQVRDGARTLHAGANQAHQIAGRRIEEILTASHAALSALQFQDPMVQDLQQLDALFAQAHTGLAAEHGLHSVGVPLRYQPNVGNIAGTSEVSGGTELWFD